MYEFCFKLVCKAKKVKVPDSNKNTSLICNLSIFCTLQTENVLWYRPKEHPRDKSPFFAKAVGNQIHNNLVTLLYS
jgi:hypothetical protein